MPDFFFSNHRAPRLATLLLGAQGKASARAEEAPPAATPCPLQGRAARGGETSTARAPGRSSGPKQARPAMRARRRDQTQNGL